jgi:hypothetical protein
MNQYDPNYYRFPRSLPPGSLPFRQFTVRPRDDVRPSSGWAWFSAGMVCGALLLGACVMGA